MASLDNQFGTSKGIKNQMNSELKEVNKTYDINGAQKYYNQLINSANNYKNTQTNLQNQMTNQAIKEINQNKEYQKQDYTKEQKGAYADWQKQSNQFARDNINLRNTGLSETGNIAMYTAYQNRVANARDTYNRALTNYDNQISNARIQNNKAIAEIAYNTLQKTLELGLQSFQYQQDMRQKKLEANKNVRDRAYNRWSDNRSYKESVRQYNKDYELKKKSFSKGSGGGSSRSYSSYGGRSYNYGSSGYSASGGSAKITKSKGGKKTTKANLKTKYTANYTPIGIKGKELQASNKLAKQILSKGYVTADQIGKATKGWSTNKKQLLFNSMKRK